MIVRALVNVSETVCDCRRGSNHLAHDRCDYWRLRPLPPVMKMVRTQYNASMPAAFNYSPYIARAGIGTALPQLVLSTLPPHSAPSISFIAFSASGRRKYATNPPRSRRPPGPAKGTASPRGHMIWTRRSGERSNLTRVCEHARTLTLPTGPNCAKNIPSDCSVTFGGRPATWMLVVSGSPVSYEPVRTGACSRAAQKDVRIPKSGNYVLPRTC